MNRKQSKAEIQIHEDRSGNIYIRNATVVPVNSAEDTISVLHNGILYRSTACTDMNTQSSRSHALFSLLIAQRKLVTCQDEVMGNSAPEAGRQEVEYLSAKFHFVDLAGSERIKRTGISGHRIRETISINCGLLALGNVISALGNAPLGVAHVPYRDSKLTRLLQDSLGGNSKTLMIACISPSDCDFVETLNTLKYANRARNIKNKVAINRDRPSCIINDLKARIRYLEKELLEFQQNKRPINDNSVEVETDLHKENMFLQKEINKLQFRLKALQSTVEIMKDRNLELKMMAELQQSPINAEYTSPEVSTLRKYLEETESLRYYNIEIFTWRLSI
ncbi:unnamed protein product [Soboliphyme baturini]|uniref:Kinesin-like protein n=1 Tax=Soboliphyme baturini TaxID=241478 RepID=A0A183ID03_9BILA|nr:unnamed protein product [Soboliphyme baturini]